MQRVAVIDYGMGNLQSVSKALETVAPSDDIIITDKPENILNADRIVFPGVGAAGDCMSQLRKLDLDHVIRQAASEKPFLGICLGMQALLSHSQENQGTNTLNIIDGEVVFFDDAARQHLKVPHMGWNQVSQMRPHPLWQDIDDGSRFYFVHSFYAQPTSYEDVFGESDYSLKFAAAIGHENVFAVQFHPEKSQHAGLQLLKNFVHWDGLS